MNVLHELCLRGDGRKYLEDIAAVFEQDWIGGGKGRGFVNHIDRLAIDNLSAAELNQDFDLDSESTASHCERKTLSKSRVPARLPRAAWRKLLGEIPAAR